MGLLINTFGDFLTQENILQNLPMRSYFKVLFSPDLQRESRSLMLLPNVTFSCGWSPTIAVGQPTD